MAIRKITSQQPSRAQPWGTVSAAPLTFSIQLYPVCFYDDSLCKSINEFFSERQREKYISVLSAAVAALDSGE